LSRIIDLISNLPIKEAVLEFKYFSISLRKQNNVTKTAKSDTWSQFYQTLISSFFRFFIVKLECLQQKKIMPLLLNDQA
jgi:hypothetical protein